jgi:hypothetical protein
VTKFIEKIGMNFLTPKVAAKGLLKKSSCLAAALGVTNIIIAIAMNFGVLLKSGLDFQQTGLRGF